MTPRVKMKLWFSSRSRRRNYVATVIESYKSVKQNQKTKRTKGRAEAGETNRLTKHSQRPNARILNENTRLFAIHLNHLSLTLSLFLLPLALAG